MDYRKYYRGGWGLHWNTIEHMFNIIKNNNIENIIEFGSGGSTEFFVEARNELNKNYFIDSFDHSREFCYKGNDYHFLNLMIRNLIICNDIDYDEMFKTKKFDKELFSSTNDIFNTGIKNATYDIQESDLKNNYDLILIDGPNGNGRNFTYFYLLNKIKSGSFIVIDDYFHYDFLDKCSQFFDFEILDESRFTSDHPNKGHAILKIK